MKKQILLKDLSQNLSPGQILLLYGDLGAGKTTFVQELCACLLVSQHVSSPTYTLVNEYIAPKFNILHSDLYRLSAVDEFLHEEIFNANKVSVVEWAEKLGSDFSLPHIKLFFNADNYDEIAIKSYSHL